jgi:hypothetical protein
MRYRHLSVLLIATLMTGCARHYALEYGEEPYGFFSGIWHGFVMPYALVTNLVSWLAGIVGFDIFQSIEIIGQPNTGLWYYVGFIAGLVPYGGASSR